MDETSHSDYASPVVWIKEEGAISALATDSEALAELVARARALRDDRLPPLYAEQLQQPVPPTLADLRRSGILDADAPIISITAVAGTGEAWPQRDMR